MTRFVVRRLLSMIGVLIAISILTFLMFTAISGGALALLLLNARSPLLRTYFAAGPGWLARLATPEAGVPYGVAIAVGALAAFPQSPLMKAFHLGF